MRIYRRIMLAVFHLLLLASASTTQAAPMIWFTADDLGGGLFQYNLTIDNNGGSEGLSGLLVLNGGSVFGLDDSSFVGAPQSVGGNPAANWSSIAPLPPFVNILSFFSLDPSADVPIGGSLSGFFFQSMEDPASLGSGDFAVVGIGSTSASEIDLGDAQLMTEPATLLLVSLALAAGAGARSRNRRPMLR